MYSRPRIQLTANAIAAIHPESLHVALAGGDPALATALGAYDDLTLDAVAADERFVSRIRVVGPDVVLGNAEAPVVDMVRQLDAPALLLADDATSAHEALTAGARGVLLASAAPRRVHAALHAIADGLIVVDEALSDSVLPHARGGISMIAPLTQREREVMHLLASGLQNKEIAKRLGISDHTVKFHVNGILGKLGVETRTEAVVQAARLGIVAL